MANLTRTAEYRITSNMQDELDKLDALYRRVNQTIQQNNAIVGKSSAAYDKSSKSVNRWGNVLQQSGYQVADFAVQVGQGQSAILAFGQQGSQLISGFGAFGAAAGAAIAIASSLYLVYERSHEEAKKLEDATRDLKDSTNELNPVLDTHKKILDEMADKYGEASAAAYELTKLNMSIAIDEQFMTIEKSGKSLAKSLDEVWGDISKGLQDNLKGSSYLISLTIGEYSRALKEMREPLGDNPLEEGLKRIETLRRIQQSSGVDLSPQIDMINQMVEATIKGSAAQERWNELREMSLGQVQTSARADETEGASDKAGKLTEVEKLYRSINGEIDSISDRVARTTASYSEMTEYQKRSYEIAQLEAELAAEVAALTETERDQSKAQIEAAQTKIDLLKQQNETAKGVEERQKAEEEREKRLIELSREREANYNSIKTSLDNMGDSMKEYVSNYKEMNEYEKRSYELNEKLNEINSGSVKLSKERTEELKTQIELLQRQNKIAEAVEKQRAEAEARKKEQEKLEEKQKSNVSKINSELDRYAESLQKSADKYKEMDEYERREYDLRLMSNALAASEYELSVQQTQELQNRIDLLREQNELQSQPTAADLLKGQGESLLDNALGKGSGEKIMSKSEKFYDALKANQADFWKYSSDVATTGANALESIWDSMDASQKARSKKLFRAMQAAKIVETIIHTATATMKAFGEYGLPGAILAAAMGAANVALIASQKPPAYATGGVTPGGTVLVGEKGPELVDLPVGSRVWSNNDSRSRMGGQPVNVIVNNNAPGTVAETRENSNGDIEVIIRAIESRIARGGNSTSKTFEQTYSLNRGTRAFG